MDFPSIVVLITLIIVFDLFSLKQAKLQFKRHCLKSSYHICQPPLVCTVKRKYGKQFCAAEMLNVQRFIDNKCCKCKY